jgi:hypothetical protein
MATGVSELNASRYRDLGGRDGEKRDAESRPSPAKRLSVRIQSKLKEPEHRISWDQVAWSARASVSDRERERHQDWTGRD